MAGMAQQRLEHALHHLHHVGFALAQVVIFDLLELRDQRIHLLLQRPFRIEALALDQVDRGFGKRAVAQDQQMQIEKSAEFRRRAGRDITA